MYHKEFFTTVLGITDPEIVGALTAAAHEEHLPRGHCLISMGEIRPSIHFLLEGVLRGYVVDENGCDITDCFICQAGDVVVGCGELHKPSQVAIETITPCRVLTLPMSLLLELMDYEQEGIEQGIRIAATLCMRALSVGVEAGFACNGCLTGAKGTGKTVYIPANNASDQGEILLTAMARLEALNSTGRVISWNATTKVNSSTPNCATDG